MTSTTSDLVDFDQLQPFQKRQFIPQQVDLTSGSEITDLYKRLIVREVGSVLDLEQWILDRSELEAALDQKGAVLYILMTCQTDDEQRAQNYKDYIENIVPLIKPLDDQLNKLFVGYVKQYPVEQRRYDLYTKMIRADLELFVEKNIELETQVDLLSQDYQSLCGAMTVDFDGRERTLPEMGKFLLDPDRDLRERAWKASVKRRLEDKDKLDELFDQMMKRRNEIARNAGFDNFCKYKFKSLHRFDYTPQDCKEFHNSMEQLAVPFWKKILEKRKNQMQLDVIRPWDTSVDPLGRPALKPFEKVADLISGCEKVFQNVDQQLGGQFSQMKNDKLLDLASRKGKAPGGYQSSLDESRKPFIFMNAVGIDSDVRTLLHESGHAFHSMACAHDPLVDYRHGPMEFNEVASMGMELLADQYLNVFYSKEDMRRSCVNHLEDIIFTLIWVATIDAFQHWIYDNPDHSDQDRIREWLNIRQRFGGGIIDWSGLEQEHSYLWHKQLHIFEVPFYYIEYGIAQLGALQLWLNNKKDKMKALEQYRSALSLGGSRPLPELFQTAGLRFDFSQNTIAPLINALEEELDQLEG